MSNAELTHKLEVLRDHCEAVGRPYNAIEKTADAQMTVSKDGREGTITPQQAIDRFGEWAELGFDTGIVHMHHVTEPEVFALWEQEIVPMVSKMAIARR